jgi:chromosome partitioning protein
MRTYAIANQKGGVGKTTVALGLASALGHRGRKVLLVDLDPQAGATKLLGLDTSDPDRRTLADLLLAGEDHPIGAVTAAGPWGFDVAASELKLARVELQRRPGDDLALRSALALEPLDYDAVLIDCPPQLGTLTTNGLAAATDLVIVTEPSYVAQAGLVDLLEVRDMVRRRLNRDLQLAGVVLNLVDNTRESRGRADEVLREFGPQAWEPFVPRRAAIRETFGDGRSLYDPASSREAHAAGEVFLALSHHLVTP